MRKLINPPGTEGIYASWHFSQAVRAGNLVWVSGQVGMDDKGIADGIEAQARAAFRNLVRVLDAAGASLRDVVEIVTFHRAMGDMAAFAKVKDEFFPENYPAWTAVGVTALALPELLVEIRATAAIATD
jgi:enamine deaminase RidA (YjgF/YER057c/UK114 family)